MKERDRVCCYLTKDKTLLTETYKERYTEGCVGTFIVEGGVDVEESFEDAAIREVFEETGLTLSKASSLSSHTRKTLDVPDFGDLPEHRHLLLLKSTQHDS